MHGSCRGVVTRSETLRLTELWGPLKTPQAFFREPEVSGKGSSARGVLARSVLIDMEPKVRGVNRYPRPAHDLRQAWGFEAGGGQHLATQVINTVMRGVGSGVHGWRYSSRSTLWGQSGSGNNW